MSVVYFMRRADGVGPVKVGFSSSPKKRLQTCACWSPYPLSIIALIEVDKKTGRYIERQFHERYLGWRLHSEWHEPCSLILSDVASISAGTFDLTGLPTPSAGVHALRGNIGEDVAARRRAIREAAWIAAHPEGAAA